MPCLPPLYPAPQLFAARPLPRINLLGCGCRRLATRISEFPIAPSHPPTRARSKKRRGRKSRPARTNNNNDAAQAETQLENALLTAEKWVPGGFALARSPKGKIVLLRNSIPQEQVRAEYRDQRKKISIGSPIEITEPSPARVAPDCARYGVCGGCDWLHLTPDAHAPAKREIISDALLRIAKMPPSSIAHVRPTLQAPRFARARRRVRLKVDKDGYPGFHALGSHQLVPIHEGCQAIDPALEVAITKLTQNVPLPPGATLQLAVDERTRVALAVHCGKADLARQTGEMAVSTDCISGAIALVDEKEVGRFGDPVLRGEIAASADGGPYASDAATFTQATRFGGNAILDAVLQATREITGALEITAANAKILELFAGAGHLTVGLLQFGARIHAVEGDRRAFDWLQRNVEQTRQSTRAQLGRFFIDPFSLAKFMENEARPDILVVDPPRTGIVGFHDILTTVKPKSLIMVSCDPATGARDLRLALDTGFTLDWLLPIDAFPRTSHVEWVAKLNRETSWVTT